MVLEFDAAKDASNQQKHGVSLAIAADFDWATVLVSPARTDRGEMRRSVIGDVAGEVYVAVATERQGRMRIISLRRANRKERQKYGT